MIGQIQGRRGSPASPPFIGTMLSDLYDYHFWQSEHVANWAEKVMMTEIASRDRHRATTAFWMASNHSATCALIRLTGAGSAGTGVRWTVRCPSPAPDVTEMKLSRSYFLPQGPVQT